MRTTIKKCGLFFACLFITAECFSQQKETDSTLIVKQTQQTVVQAVAAKKTNVNWGIIADMYQLSLNDLTGNSKSVSFGATIKAIDSMFRKPDANKIFGRFATNFQPQLSLGYKNNFQSINGSFGFKYAVINRTDAKHRWEVNKNPELFSLAKQLAEYDQAFIDRIRQNAEDKQNDSVAIQAFLGKTQLHSSEGQKMANAYKMAIGQQFETQEKEITAMILAHDPKKMTPDLQIIFNQSMTGGRSLAGFIAIDSTFSSRITTITHEIANGLVININPMATYDITRAGFQGLDLGVNGSKGFSPVTSTHTLQLVGKFDYIIGTDTIVSAINNKRKQITDQLGLNRVMATSTKRSQSSNVPTPWLEASLTGAYNYVYTGLKPKEKNAQPALNFKMAILVGKSAWFTVPLTYNFGTKSAMALISINANIGSALF